MSESVFKYSYGRGNEKGLTCDGKPYQTAAAIKSAIATGRNYVKPGDIVNITEYDLVPKSNTLYVVKEDGKLKPAFPNDKQLNDFVAGLGT